MTSDSGGDYDPETLFDTSRNNRQQIYNNRELVDTNHVPAADKIVGRKEEIQRLANVVSPLIDGQPTNSVLIYGKTGTGKSLVAKHIMQRLEIEAEQRPTDIGTAYVNCGSANGTTRAVRNIGASLAPEVSSVSFPTRGLSTDEYFERIWEVVNTHYDSVIITVDEVDMLRDDSPLMVLSRAGETGVADVPISIIAISNKINYRDQMDERTKSSFGHREFVFDPYDAAQLREILEHRREAFQENVLGDAVIPRIAALAAKEHGDARKGVNLLFYLGEHAVEEGYDKITEEMIDDVRELADAERLNSLISGLPSHARLIIVALAALTKGDEGTDQWFRTSDIFDTYEIYCEREGADPLSGERRRQILDELSFLEITEAKTNHGGKNVGTYKEHRLMYDPDVVEHVYEATDPTML
ncbi:Cdc6/Cdc18 family protein (plasmid) [Halorientalis pallida]|uniref:Cdc6/Cdc18 family protein n=1 Tax=Halorientalis pallida TaxID=2479928 RepID=UPI003C6FD82E